MEFIPRMIEKAAAGSLTLELCSPVPNSPLLFAAAANPAAPPVPMQLYCPGEQTSGGDGSFRVDNPGGLITLTPTVCRAELFVPCDTAAVLPESSRIVLPDAKVLIPRPFCDNTETGRVLTPAGSIITAGADFKMA